MRVLQICPKPPRPIVDGGCIAMDTMTCGLRGQGHSVKVLAMATEKQEEERTRLSKKYFNCYIH